MAAKILYGLTGDKRKKLAASLANILGAEAAYAGAPTFNYRVGDYTVDRYGSVICPDDADIADLLAKLEAEGFHGEAEEDEQPETAEAPSPAEEATAAPETPQTAEPEETSDTDAPAEEAPDTAPEIAAESESDKLTISFPRELVSDATLVNLQNMIASRATVIRHALDTNDLSIVIEDDKISFPWFHLTGSEDEARAYAQFLEAMIKAAKEAKYVNPIEKIDDNEKLSMRLFLVTKLGFIGPDFKLARKILTRNLSGNSSWRHGAPQKQNTPDTDSNTSSDPVPDIGETTPCPSEPIKEEPAE